MQSPQLGVKLENFKKTISNGTVSKYAGMIMWGHLECKQLIEQMIR